MRMSMAGKIYTIVVILLVVAAIILGLGIYSIREITSSMEAVIRQANRVSNMDNVDKIALQRRITTDAIINSVDEAEMKRMIDTDMDRLEVLMDQELKDYVANFDVPPRSRPNRIRKKYAEFLERVRRHHRRSGRTVIPEHK